MTDPFGAAAEPPRIKAVEGQVVVIGDGVCTALTPEAAKEAADRLLLAANFAEQHQTAAEIFEL